MADELYDRIQQASTMPTEESIAEVYNVILALLSRVEQLESGVRDAYQRLQE